MKNIPSNKIDREAYRACHGTNMPLFDYIMQQHPGAPGISVANAIETVRAMPQDVLDSYKTTSRYAPAEIARLEEYTQRYGYNVGAAIDAVDYEDKLRNEA